MAIENGINYRLKDSAKNNVIELINIIDLLKDNHPYIKKLSFEPGDLPDSERFEVIYDDRPLNKDGNISPKVLRDLLVEIQRALVENVSDTNASIYLPKEFTDEFEIFYFRDIYENAIDKKSLQTIIDTIYKVAHGELKKKVEESESDNKAGDISEFSLSFRQGNLIDNCSREKRGVLAFANHLLNDIKKYGKETPLISGETFGRPKGEFYYFGNALGALSEYHREFKDYIKNHPNFKHPEGSKERKALDRLINKDYPFFSGRGIALLDSNLEGKISTDDGDLKEFIEIFKDALKALGEKVPEKPVGGGEEGDEAEGGAEEEPDEKKDKKDLITSEGLYELIRTRLISYIYETFYQEAVKSVSSETQYETRSLILGIISIRIDSNINLRALINNELSSNWLSHVEDDQIHNSEDLAKDIESFVKYLASPQFYFEESVEETINRDILQAQNSLRGIEAPEKKAKLPGLSANDPTITANIIAFSIATNKEEYSADSWEKLSDPQKGIRLVDFWKGLSRAERLEFLKQNNLFDYVEQYADSISIQYLEEQLSRNNISISQRSNFLRLLNEMKAEITEGLISIPPTELGGDIEIFLARQRRDSSFLVLEQQWINEFAPRLENEIGDFVTHHPQIISFESIKGKSYEEIALSINSSLTGNAAEDKINEAAEKILDQILNDLGLPRGVRLDDLDRRQSIQEIQGYLRIYLKNRDVDYLYILFSKDSKFDLFVNRYSTKLLSEKGAFFLPLVQERIYEAHRQHIFKKIQNEIGISNNPQAKINFENTLYSILSEAALSQSNPENYISKLSAEDLDNLFGLSALGIKLSKEDYDDLRDLILQYVNARSKNLFFKDSQELDKDEFSDGALYLREQASSLRNQGGGGRIIYSVITYEPASIDEEQDAVLAEAELETLAKERQIRQIIMAQAIWNAYTLEQQQLLASQEAQNLAIYQQQQILDQQPDADTKKKKGLLKKGIDKLKDKGINASASGATALLGNAIVPGAGAAVAGFINALPISEKNKKYLTIGALGGIVGFIGTTGYLFLNTAGGFIGGIVGGIVGGVAGFFSGGFLGILPGATTGWFAGTWAGAGAEYAIRNSVGGAGTVSGTTSSIGNGISNTIGGGSSTASQLGAPISQGGIPVGTGAAGTLPPITPSYGLTAGGLSSTYVAAASVLTTSGILFFGGNLTTNNLHSIFLQNVPGSVAFDQETSSKYVSINKTANPSVMENDENRDIVYSITITPNDGYVITVSQTSDEITILGENASNYSFEIDQNQITEQLQPSTIISSPTTIEYTLPNVSGTDIALNNTFVLDFSVEDNGEIVTDSISGSATVLIGDPELGCFVFGDSGQTVNAINIDTSEEITDSDKSYIINAYQRILNNTTFMRLLCSDGPITIYKLGSDQIGGYSVDSNTVALYDFNRWSGKQAVVDYTLIHEFGHTISKRNPGLQNDFQANWGGSCFTYNLEYSYGTCYISEAFPEALVLYEIHSYYNFSSGLYDFPSINPREYQWIETNIYGGGN
ncbi:MAG: hypothetical protein OEX81_04535 [Candidatus Pacebacteria bacterium]|nr:hypothetical protein [Candidatus Paceibacterota bacterium]